MAIVDTITNVNKLYHDLQDTSNYKDNFSYAGAEALFIHLDDLSDETGENLEYDPIAWCCEFSEYDSLQEFNEQYNSADPFESWDEVAENTTVLKLISGAVVADF